MINPRLAVGISIGVAVALLVSRDRGPPCDTGSARGAASATLSGLRPTSLYAAVDETANAAAASASASVATPPPPPPPSAASAAAAADGHGELPPIAGPRACRRRKRKLKLAIGIITAPTHFDRRLWIRQKLRVSDACARGVRVLFVLGTRNRMTKPQQLAIRHEERAHGDIVFVEARDWVPHAVAEKSLAWWQWADTHLEAEWYVKTDDDSLMSLPRVEADLAAMGRMGRSHYYYGVMTWRVWTPYFREPDAACGERGDDGPQARGPSGRLRRLIAGRKPGAECAGAVGPFPFADGSLQALSADLMAAFVRSPLAVNFSSAHRGRTKPPFWTHEDAAVGYLIYHSAMIQKLPLTYVVLSAWKHNKFWINWFPPDNPSLPDGHVVNTHKVVTSMMAQIADDAYRNTTFSADPIRCVDCGSAWGWADCFDSDFGRAPVERFACCNKRV